MCYSCSTFWICHYYFTPTNTHHYNTDNVTPQISTFVDDSFLKKTIKPEGKDLKQTVLDTMDTVEQYALANKLQLNTEKTQIMLLTHNKQLKEQFSVHLNGRDVKHKNEIMLLGNLMSDNLTWAAHVTKILIPSLRNRVRTLKCITKYMDNGFRVIYFNSLFRSKLMFGLETWGGGGVHHSI